MGGETAGVLISMRPSSGVAIGWPSTLAKCHPALPLSGGPSTTFSLKVQVTFPSSHPLTPRAITFSSWFKPPGCCTTF